MLLEQLLFIFVSFAIFVYMFFRMIKRNDTSYVVILVLEAMGIAINFLEVLFDIKLNILFKILKYVLAVLVPIIVIILEKKEIYLYEAINLTKAKICLMFNDNKRAKEALIALLDKNRNSYKAHKMLAEIYEKEGGMRKAIDEYVQAIDIYKQDYDSYFKVAELLNGLNKKEEASQMLFNLLNKKPDTYEASLLLGDILIETEMYKEAVNVYQDALKYNPYSYDINYSLGIAYTMLNDFQSAKTCYEKAAEINSLAYALKYDLAEIALIYKDIEEAERKFLEAVNEEELSADSYYELAKISLIKNEKDTAIKYINTAIDIESKKIVDKVKKDPIFIPIMARISIPFNLESKEQETISKLSKKEIKVKEHLEEMSEITRHLSYNDINLLRKNKKEKIKENEIEKQNEIEQKERHD